MASTPRQSSFFPARGATVVILLIGVLGAVWAFYDARERDRQRAESEFSRRATILHSLTGEIIGNYESALSGLHLAFTLEGGVSRAEFAQLTRTLAERNPGVKA